MSLLHCDKCDFHYIILLESCQKSSQTKCEDTLQTVEEGYHCILQVSRIELRRSAAAGNGRECQLLYRGSNLMKWIRV